MISDGKKYLSAASAGTLKKCKISNSLKSGFEKTGIYPFGPATILKTVPAASTENDLVNAENEEPIDVVVPAFASTFLSSVVKPKRKLKDA